jgi:hypothetical protein
MNPVQAPTAGVDGVANAVNQLLKCYNSKQGVGYTGKHWFVKTTDVDNKQHYLGKFTSPMAAADYYKGYTRLKMVALIAKYSIPAATAEKLLSL